MKVKEFRENFEIDRTAKGVKARSKNGSALPEAKTADGEIFNPEQRYYFFDRSSGKVRQSIGIRRIDAEYLGSFGLRVCKISELRNNRADALGDGQSYFRDQITELQEKISDFEAEKDS